SVSKSLSSSIGIQGGNSVGISMGSGQLTDGTNLNNFLDGNPNTVATSSNQAEGRLGIGFNAGSLEVGVLLEALESKGVVRTLAEPNLTALSGQEASFLAGGEYPIPVMGDNGAITIEY